MPISWLMGRNVRGSGGKTIISPITTEWQTPSGQTLQSRGVISVATKKGEIKTFPVVNQPAAVQVKVTPTGSSQPVLVPTGPTSTTTPSSTTTSSGAGSAESTPSSAENENAQPVLISAPAQSQPETGTSGWLLPVAILGGLGLVGLGLYAASKGKRRR